VTLRDVPYGQTLAMRPICSRRRAAVRPRRCATAS